MNVDSEAPINLAAVAHSIQGERAVSVIWPQQNPEVADAKLVKTRQATGCRFQGFRSLGMLGQPANLSAQPLCCTVVEFLEIPIEIGGRDDSISSVHKTLRIVLLSREGKLVFTF